MPEFRAQRVREGFAGAMARSLYALERELEDALRGFVRRVLQPSAATVRAENGDFVRLSPQAGTEATVLLPRARDAIDGRVIVSLETAGSFRVVAAESLVNAQSFKTFAAVGFYEFLSDGKATWWCAAVHLDPGSVTNAQLALMPGFSIKVQPVAGDGVPQDYPAANNVGVPGLFGSGMKTRAAQLTFDVNGWARGGGGFYDEFQYVQSASVTTEPYMCDSPWRFEVIAGAPTIGPLTTVPADNHPGNARITLPANATMALSKSALNITPWRFADVERIELIMKGATSQTGLIWRFGLSSNGLDIAAAAHAAYFELDQAADPTIHARTRKSSAATSDNDLGQAFSTLTYRVLTLERASNGDLTFRYNDTTATVTVPAATHGILAADGVTLSLWADTAGTACNLDVDYTALETNALGGRTA